VPKIKLIGCRDQKTGYTRAGYYIRYSVNNKEDKETVIAWCSLLEGDMVDHNTIRFNSEEDAIKFLEMFN
jgi:hypothetical protein